MNLSFMKDISNQLIAVWRDMKLSHKVGTAAVLSVLIGMFMFLVINASSSSWVPLYPSERLLVSDSADIKEHLDALQMAYKIQGETQIMVPETAVRRIRMELASVGLPKMHSNKGFELFDSNTWIKGEKELQVLEMRALKGQLESDIAEYENVSSATVILDIAPPRPFGSSVYKTKASVILNLKPGARLDTSQLRAITYHIAGAVRGLTPNMVAISDTTGKLYQAMDPDGTVDTLRSAEIAVEERLKSKIDGMLAAVIGADNFYSTVQVTMSRNQMTEEQKIVGGAAQGINLGQAALMSVTGSPAVTGGKDQASLTKPSSHEETPGQAAVPVHHLKVQSQPGKIESISIGVMIDKTITVDPNADLPPEELVLGRRDASKLREEVENQLEEILEGYEVKTTPAVDFVEFNKTRYPEKVKEESATSTLITRKTLGTVFSIVLAVLAMSWTAGRLSRKKIALPPKLKEEEDTADAGEEPNFVEVEAYLEAVKARFQSDPDAVVKSIRDWLA